MYYIYTHIYICVCVCVWLRHPHKPLATPRQTTVELLGMTSHAPQRLKNRPPTNPFTKGRALRWVQQGFDRNCAHKNGFISASQIFMHKYVQVSSSKTHDLWISERVQHHMSCNATIVSSSECVQIPLSSSRATPIPSWLSGMLWAACVRQHIISHPRWCKHPCKFCHLRRAGREGNACLRDVSKRRPTPYRSCVPKAKSCRQKLATRTAGRFLPFYQLFLL